MRSDLIPPLGAEGRCVDKKEGSNEKLKHRKYSGELAGLAHTDHSELTKPTLQEERRDIHWRDKEHWFDRML